MGLSKKLREEKKELVEACAVAQGWLNDLKKGGDAPALLVEAIERVVSEWDRRNMEIDQGAVSQKSR